MAFVDRPLGKSANTFGWIGAKPFPGEGAVEAASYRRAPLALPVLSAVRRSLEFLGKVRQADDVPIHHFLADMIVCL
jgi:hypothetical protein